MRVLIIGAGLSGIITAKTLRDLGHSVTVLEKCSDVGGVWSSSRTYPGLTTQNTKDTYFFSDKPLPKEYPEWPAGQQVLDYLKRYVEVHHLVGDIHLNSEVFMMKRKQDEKGWIIKTSSGLLYDADHVVICTGIFSQPCIPSYDGHPAYEAAGGCIVHTSEVGTLEAIQGKSVVIVGYGKSACDMAHAVAVDGGATHVTMIIRHLVWKLPRHILGLCYKWLLLTRFGEALFEYIRPTSIIERFLHCSDIGRTSRNFIIGSLQAVVTRTLRLGALGLEPDLPFDTIARSNIGLSTDGFYAKVEDGLITLKHGTEIVNVGAREESDGNMQAGATLLDGTFIPADVIICGTGFRQDPPHFLPEDVQSALTDENGDWVLYQHIKPPYMDDLTFNGFNSSLFCPTGSEVAALWIGSYLVRGERMLPTPDIQETLAKEKLAWLTRVLGGKHSRGTCLIPFSLHTIDDVLSEIGVNISAFDRLKQWVFPVDPTAYRGLHNELAVLLAQES